MTAILICTSLLLIVRVTSIAGEKKTCLMVVKCIESSFKMKTKSGITSDNNKELEKLILPFGSSFSLQSHISMVGKLPASTQEREVSVVYTKCHTFCNACYRTAWHSLLCLSDKGSPSMKPICESPSHTSEVRLGLGPFRCSKLPFLHCKTWEVSFYGTGGCCGISG